MDWIPFLNHVIWRNAGFGSLRPIRSHIEHYESRFDPTVIPIAVDDNPFDDTHQDEGINENKIIQEQIQRHDPRKYYSVADYHALYMSGELTPTAVVKSILPLIRRDTSPPGEYSVAWFDCHADRVLEAAEASTRRYKAKKPLGVLDGVPTAVKDEVLDPSSVVY